ncbi:PhzF family phenazine biosynthesis protein [Marinobacter orientalis]|uniref:PhzF family phenazine biosynthesis protein n=1 Tax=Marinobacter orientalis TaxID=1928859 RepID=A0A7Y0RDN0_9GAMM|nr:PhzF family phenazine biosynthesis protein [Marinobacter orientalis]NMT64320.1 PhzF family phenazine biosynthesis protein [Marinobacter orientalis]TGX49533.1 PhzF family phenazine biosynthesis protein [Marinobacter orientalis]
MEKLPIYQIDAFTSEIFGGNPAAVMPLEQWLPDDTLRALARENNLSETAFLVPLPAEGDADFHIRWFTPTVEVSLCGHATLASAWVIFNKLGWEREWIRLQSKSGPLNVRQTDDDWLELDFPNLPFEERPTPDLIHEALKDVPDKARFVPDDTNYLISLKDEAAVRSAQPDIRKLRELGNQGVIITAPGNDCDFVSRYFAPGAGIDEDPVTGSIHSVLVPYWARQLGKNTLLAKQVSARGGVLRCELKGDRVAIAGQAAFYMEGSVHLP